MGSRINQEYSPKHDQLRTVQTARGIAALLVVLYHCQNVINLPQYHGTLPFSGAFQFGHAGVEFFFVLSGFIIFYVHRQDLNLRKRLFNYIWRRVTRIYPLFLFVMIAVVIKSIIKGDFECAHFLKTILLLPQPPYPMLIQSWTLVHEMLFYCLFGIAIVSISLGRLVFGLWMASVIYAEYAGLNLAPGLVTDVISVVSSPYNLLFVFGMFVAWVVSKWTVPLPRPMAAIGVICFLITGAAENAHLLDQHVSVRIWLFGISAGIVLIGLVAGEVAGSIRVRKFGDLLGDLSYPLYLVHGAVISVTISAMKAGDILGPDWFALLVSVAAACLVAYLLNRIVEKPISSVLRRIWDLQLSRRVAS